MILALPIGLALIAAAVVDLLWTVVAAGSGSGPLTGRLATFLWRGLLAVSRRRGGHTLLEAGGVGVLLTLLVTWVAMVLVGWWLVFSSTEGAVRNATTKIPADLVDRFYYAGYTALTLGSGDYIPGQGWWQLATVATVASGLILLTLAVTYLVPVASAVAERRQLASSLSALGSDGERM